MSLRDPDIIRLLAAFRFQETDMEELWLPRTAYIVERFKVRGSPCPSTAAVT
jgi:hypothetical protein